jgi:PST family polysaccharide transporter
MIILAQVILSYCAILVNFGINNIAVAEVSLNQDKKLELSNLVSNIYILKGFFFLISFLLILVLILFFEKAKENWILLLLSSWVCVNEFLVPLWYFQGRGKIKTFVFLSLFIDFTYHQKNHKNQVTNHIYYFFDYNYNNNKKRVNISKIYR